MARLLANGFAQALAAFFIAWLLRRAFSEGVDGGGSTIGGASPLVVGGLFFVGAAVLALRIIEQVDSERVGQDYVMKTRLLLFDRIAAIPSRSTRPMRFGLTMTRMVTDLNSLKQWVSVGVASMGVALVSGTGSLAALAYFNPWAAAVAAGVVMACVGAAALLTPSIRNRVRRTRRRRGELAGNIGEKIFAIETVRHLGQTGKERRRIRAQSRRLADAAASRWHLSGALRALPDAAYPIALAALIAVIGSGGRGAGGFVVTFVLLGMIMSSLRDIALAWDYRLSFEEGRRRINDILSQERMRDGADAEEVPGEASASITFRDVEVTGVFDHVSATAEAGDHVLVTGPTGGGKSTLFALAARLLDPNDGEVLLDGVPLRRLSIDSIRAAVQLVSPELPLLRGTVGKNIAYGLDEAEPNLIEHVAAICDLDQTGDLSPDGLDTRVEEKGQNLPPGLRARIALARALVRKPQLLLIDDPAFAADRGAALALQRASAVTATTVLMAGAEKGCALVPDRIWHMGGGTLVEAPPTRTETALRVAQE